MVKRLSEVALNKVSSLVYLPIADKEESGIYQIYKAGNNEITIGQLIVYYKTAKGQQDLAQRFKGKIAGESELGYWQAFLNELQSSTVYDYTKWTITNVKSNNEPAKGQEELKLDETGYYKNSGFVACIVHTSQNEAVIAFRGSEPLGDINYFNDWESDLRVAYQKKTYQQSDAVCYIKEAARHLEEINHFYVTGHSLGGNLALYATMNIPDSLKEKLVSTTTFAAPGFNQDVIEKYEKVITRLRLDGKITEYQNYLDPVGSLLHNPTQPIYIASIRPGAAAFDNHSSFLNAVNHDGKTFKKCDIQQKSELCNKIHGATLAFDKLPYQTKYELDEWVLGVWKHTLEAKHVAEKIIKVEINAEARMATIKLGQVSPAFLNRLIADVWTIMTMTAMDEVSSKLTEELKKYILHVIRPDTYAFG